MKRCIGLPGETFEIKDNLVYIDGEALEEPSKLQYNYFVETDGTLITDKTFESWGVSIDDRNYTNNKVPVRVPADVAGAKVRVQESEIQMAQWKAWGANPTPMAFAEVLPALQQGTIDAQENPLAIIDANKLYEVQHYISLTGHVFSPHCLYINQERYDSLDPELQQALDKAAAAYQTAQRARATELNALSVQKFRDAGCEVIEVTDAEKDQWRQMAIDGKVYDLVREKMEHPELLDKVLNKEF